MAYFACRHLGQNSDGRTVDCFCKSSGRVFEDEVLSRHCLGARLFTVQCSDMSSEDVASQTAKSRKVPGSTQELPDPHQRSRRRRRRRDRRRDASSGKVSPSVESEIRLSPTIIHMESSTFNPTLAFILGGNEDFSDADGDWDEVRGDCDSDLAVDIVFGMFSVIPQIRSLDEGFDDVKHLSALLRDANARWSESYADVKTGHRNSKVHFAADGRLVETLRADDIDRRGTWEQAASDRLRFRCRISAAEKVLSPILDAEHRERVLQRMKLSQLLL